MPQYRIVQDCALDMIAKYPHETNGQLAARVREIMGSNTQASSIAWYKSKQKRGFIKPYSTNVPISIAAAPRGESDERLAKEESMIREDVIKDEAELAKGSKFINAKEGLSAPDDMMSSAKYPFPEFLTGRCTPKVYGKWLSRKATAHVKRDRRRGHEKATREAYMVAIHQAVMSSRGLDDYTGQELAWENISTYNNEESKKAGEYIKINFITYRQLTIMGTTLRLILFGSVRGVQMIAKMI